MRSRLRNKSTSAFLEGLCFTTLFQHKSICWNSVDVEYFQNYLQQFNLGPKCGHLAFHEVRIIVWTQVKSWSRARIARSTRTSSTKRTTSAKIVFLPRKHSSSTKLNPQSNQLVSQNAQKNEFSINRIHNTPEKCCIGAERSCSGSPQKQCSGAKRCSGQSCLNDQLDALKSATSRYTPLIWVERVAVASKIAIAERSCSGRYSSALLQFRYAVTRILNPVWLYTSAIGEHDILRLVVWKGFPK